MRMQFAMGGVVLLTVCGTAIAQAPRTATVPMSSVFVDPLNGLSLDDAIAQALSHNPSIVGIRQQVDVARGESVQARLRPNPTLGFEQRTEPAGTDSLSMVTVEWPLDLFRQPAREAVAEARVRAASSGTADRERTFASQVRGSYGDVLIAIRNLEVLEQVIHETSRQRDVLTARVDAGRSAPLERDVLHVELGRLEADHLLQVGEVETALIRLKRLLGLPSHTPLSVKSRLETLIAADGEGPAPTESYARADVREAEARVSIADALLTQATQEGRFDVNLYGAYMRMDAGFPQLGLTPTGGVEQVRGVFHYVTGGLRMTLPIRNRNQGAVAAAKAEQAISQSALNAVRLSADAEHASARAQDARARAAMRVYRDGVLTLARKNLSTVEETYELGRLTLLDVVTERRRYLDVERGYSDALRAGYEARTALLTATGGGR